MTLHIQNPVELYIHNHNVTSDKKKSGKYKEKIIQKRITKGNNCDKM